MDMSLFASHECSLCSGPAGAFDSIDLVTIKDDYFRGTRTTNGLKIYICKDCMERYKAEHYKEEHPKLMFSIFTGASLLIGGLILIINLAKGRAGDAITVPIIILVIGPAVSFFMWRRIENKFGPKSKPMDPLKLPIESMEMAVAVFNMVGSIDYAKIDDWKTFQKNPNGYTLPKGHSTSIEEHKYHYLEDVVKVHANKEAANLIQVDPNKEESLFIAKLKEKYAKGIEFSVRDIKGLISEEYVSWFAKKAQENKIYSINWRESAVVDLLGAMARDGVIGNKRVEVRNEFGDEDWFYTML